MFWSNVGAIIGRPQDVTLSDCGKIVERAIQNIAIVYPSVLVESYVIMPNHVHLLLTIDVGEGGRPVVAPTRGCVP